MLAIVIPFYKIHFFEETLFSLAKQTNKNFNVYIGDDSSPDNPAPIIEQFKQDLNLIYRKFEKNVGGICLTKHWERCVEMSKDEEWIMILGDDDFLSENVVQSWYDNYKCFYRNASLVRYATNMIDEKSVNISHLYEHPIWETPENAFYRKFRSRTRSSLSEYVFKKSAYKHFKFFPYPIGWYSDDRAWLEFSAGNSIYAINNASLSIRISPISFSGSMDYEREKKLARYMFFKFLVEEKLNGFRKKQKVEIIRSYHLSILNFRKMNKKEFFQLSFLHLRFFNIIFMRKFLKSFFV